MISNDKILSIKNFPSLVNFLAEELQWPIDLDEFDDYESLSYDFNPKELGIREEFISKIKNIKQLRPIGDNPFAIFWIEFENKKLPIVALRRILNKFVEKKRELSDQIKWPLDEILFVTSHNEEETRSIALSQFRKNKDKEIIREFWWDKGELNFRYISEKLEYLKWPESGVSKNEWKDSWSKAFDSSIKVKIENIKILSETMANVATEIKKRVEDIYEMETASGELHKLYNTFKVELIHNLKPYGNNGFSDLFAQTIVYGFLAWRYLNEEKKFNINRDLSGLNSFLRNFFRKIYKNVDLNVLEINDLIEEIINIKFDEIKLLFGRRTKFGKEDPVIHFYEGFLNYYDRNIKSTRGVYYTPDEVVKFIVNSIHIELKKSFGLKLGLADNTTWGELVKTKKIKLPEFFKKNIELKTKLLSEPFVKILDPCVGTGTFLKEVINKIYETMENKWLNENKNENEIRHLWCDYVDKYLLNKIYGFEIMMAPFTICQMNLSFFLKNTGYKFNKNKDFNIHLTNSLENPKFSNLLFEEFIEKESRLASIIKSEVPFTVIVGNPPYSIFSANLSAENKIIIDKFRYVDGKKIIEKNALGFERTIQDDYIKFFSIYTNYVNKSENALLGIITNRSYLNNISLRGLRNYLITTFNKINILDLFGNISENKIDESGKKDEGVFDISQGVAIFQGLKKNNLQKKILVEKSELSGSRNFKYEYLNKNNFASIKKDKVKLKPDKYLFDVFDNDLYDKYYNSTWSINDIFDLKRSGVETGFDDLLVDIDQNKLIKKLEIFSKQKNSDDLKLKYNKTKGHALKLINNNKKLFNSHYDKKKITSFLFRPFDLRYIYYNKNYLQTHSDIVCKNIIDKENLIFIAMRQVTIETDFNHFFVSNTLINNRSFKSSRGKTFMYPLFIYYENNEQISNMNKNFINDFSNKLKFNTIINKKEGLDSSINIINIAHYIYALQFLPSYKKLFKYFLKGDYPRIFICKDKIFFEKFCKLGADLIAIHLGNNYKYSSWNLKNKSHNYIGSNDIEIIVDEKNNKLDGKILHKDNKLYLNNDSYISNMDKKIIMRDFGGYNIIKNWFTSRKNFVLNEKNIREIKKLLVAIINTEIVEKNIENLVEKHGGFEKVFL